MTATITAVRTALAEALSTIDGLRTFATLPDNIAPPAAVVEPDTGIFLEYGTALAGQADDIRLRVGLFVSRASDRAGAGKLDGYIASNGPHSIRAAVEADPTLGGVVDSVQVTQALNWGQVTFGGVDYYGCEFIVEALV